MKLVFALCFAAVFVNVPALADISRARAALAQYEAEIEASAEARLGNDFGRALSHEANARKHVKTARDEFAAAGAGESSDVSVLRDYASALMANEDHDLAAGVLRRAAVFEPEDAKLWVSLGFAVLELGANRANDAAAAFRNALEALERGQAEIAAAAHLGLGEAYRKRNLHKLARESYVAAIEAQPDMRAARLAFAALRARDGEVVEASSGLDELGAFSGEETALLADILAESLKAFESARLVFPETHEHHMAYAKLLLRAGKHTQALMVAERAVALDATDYVAWNLVGGLNRQMGHEDRAREAYLRSLEINPDQPRTRDALNALDS